MQVWSECVCPLGTADAVLQALLCFIPQMLMYRENVYQKAYPWANFCIANLDIYVITYLMRNSKITCALSI